MGATQIFFRYPFFRTAGLPDGLVSDRKYQFGYIFEGPEVDIVGIFCAHLWEYTTAALYIFLSFVWLFGIFFPVLVYCVMKNLATLCSAKIADPDDTIVCSETCA
jgi:hypothetical protein